MHNPQQIIDEINNKSRLLDQKNDEYGTLIERSAQAERDFNIAYAQKILSLKTDGEPATLIPKLALGDKVVSELKFKMDVSVGVMKACLESIKDLRTRIDWGRSQLAWLREELHRT